MNRLNVTVEATENTGEWKVIKGIEYKGIQVQPGMITDGASIPLSIQWLIGKGGKLFTPAVIHDTGYGLGLLTRLGVDNIFRDAMRDNKVPQWKASLIYTAVRFFGASHYKRRCND